MSERLDCPSAAVDDHARLFGVVDDDQRVQFLGAPIPLESQLVEALARDDQTARRLRFTAPCAQGACAQWRDGGCGVARRVAAAVTTELPSCGLRDTCRWWAQEGTAACAACVWVRTDNREPYGPLPVRVRQ